MHTDSSVPLALFLFAHQDDEFGIFYQIEQEQRIGHRVCCIYATNGATTADPNRRNTESRIVLHRLGVASDDIIFIGQQLGIADGSLHVHVEVLADWLSAFIDAHPEIENFFVPAWEGGHPDHDLVHAVAVQLLATRDRLEKIRQYSLYNGYALPGPLFRVLSPLSENGPVERESFGWSDRFRYVRLCLAYPSQWKTWLGIFPFASWRYLFGGVQYLQRVDQGRLTMKPHAGRLYYERRAFLDWPTMCAAVERLQVIYEKIKNINPPVDS
jgi:LmbE family N-acetylglucosaminyl deacetylase